MKTYLITSLISALIGIILTKIIDFFSDNKEYIRICLGLIGHRNEKIRISCAYLFRIKNGNRYLLIKGKKIDQYQPVGGVYKTYSSFGEIANKYEVSQERENFFYEQDDLRKYIPGKKVIKFIKWFNSGGNREFTVTREFCEELIKPGFLPQESLLDVKFEFIKQAECKLRYSKAFDCREILIHNIFEVSFSDQIFLDELIKSVTNSNDELIWASENDILREAINIDGTEMKIGAHAKEVI